MLERSMWWYKSILDKAKEKADRQGYIGARWPKMTYKNGSDSPSPIGPLLIWQHAGMVANLMLLLGSRKTDNGR